MVDFRALIVQSETPGAAMVGWAYIEVPQGIAERIKPDYRQVFRVRGTIDEHPFSGLALMPKGEGDYFLAINGTMRKQLGKDVGDMLSLRLEEDTDFVIEIPADLEMCLSDEPILMERFMKLSKSNRNYFLNYVGGAKAEHTRAKRIALTVEAMEKDLPFGAMIRLDKARRRHDQ